MKKEEKKELAVKQSTAVGQVAKDEWDLGDVNSSDMIIPKLMVMQSTSKLVQQEKAEFGDLVNSVSGEILGSCREKALKPVQFIPFKEQKEWTEFEIVGKKPEFRGVIGRNAANDDLPREYEVNKKPHIRYKTLSFFVLLVEDLKNNEMPIPYVLSFRSTSFKAGRALDNHFVMCKAALQRGKMVPPPATVFELSGVKTSNDKGTFYVLEVKGVGEAKPEWVMTAAQWLKTMKTKSYQVDQSDLPDEDGERPVVRDIKPGEIQENAAF